MSSKASSIRLGLFCLLLAGAFVATTAHAQTATYPVHPFYTNSRAQIGNGLPIPIGPTPPPNGRIKPVPGPGGIIQPTAGADPRSMMFLPGGVTAPGNPINIGVFLANSMVFQVNTAIQISGPGNFPPTTTTAADIATFSAGARTGPPTLTWCPGLPVPTAAYNPSCTGGETGLLSPGGSLRYQKTISGFQFGGVSQSKVGGNADVALVAAFGNPSCTPLGACLAAIIYTPSRWQ
jgi:hypothetical protein